MTVQRVSEEYEEISAFAQQSRALRRYNPENMTVSVSFREIIDHSPQLYEKLMDEPVRWLSAFQRYVRETSDRRAQLLLTGEPVASRRVSPRQLNAAALCRLWAVSGVVTKAAPPMPTLRSLVTYDGVEKRHITSEYADPRLSLGASTSTAWLPRDADVIREYGLSDFGAVQEVTIQDDAASVPQGRAPVALQVILLDSLVDSCKAGDYVEIVGTLLPARGSGLIWEYRSPQLSTQIGQFLLAVSVKQADRQNLDEKIVEIQTEAGETGSQIQTVLTVQNGSDGISDSVPGTAQRDLQLITQILNRQRTQELKTPRDIVSAFLQACQSASPKNRSNSLMALELLAATIAPGVYGHHTIKKALVLQQLGGQPRLKAGTRTRGDINILLIGAPGCGKSQLLRSAMKTSFHALSASGRGASGAGLTAAVTVDRQGNRNLAAGAFVLADGGLLAIDEFDKLQIADRSAVHEAMEQQTVSVSKAGVHVTLNARASVLAAANCVYGDFQDDLSLRDNLNLPESILSRFDLVFRVRDSHENDGKIATFVLRNHQFAQVGVGDGFQGASGAEGVLEAPDGETGGGRRKAPQADIFETIPRELFQPYNAELHGAALKKLQRLNARDDAVINAERFLLRREVFRTLVAYCKAQKAPLLTPKAALAAASAYASLRKEAPPEVLVTVRALESLIRLSTALARLSNPPRDVLATDISEAYALLRVGLFGDSEHDAAAAAKLREPKRRFQTSETSQSTTNSSQSDSEDFQTQQLSEEEFERANAFWQAFSEIIQEQGGQQITIADLSERLNVWTTERAALNIQPFSMEEINNFLQFRQNKDGSVVVDSGVVYF